METKILFGPVGIGSAKDAAKNLEEFYELGIRACEIPFTYQVFIKKQEHMKEIKKAAEKYNIILSVHAQYWVNLNSKEKAKVEASKKRILDCCEVGEKIGAKRVVFHPGFYAGMDKETTYQNIKKQILKIQEALKKNNWKIKLAPETTGKVNVFGSIEEIVRLIKETNCSFCIDFAHILAREKKVDYDKIKKLFDNEKVWHCHFSGIEYGEKGERRHKKTPKKEWEKLLENLPKNKKIIIINESPDPLGDTIEGMRVYKKL